MPAFTLTIRREALIQGCVDHVSHILQGAPCETPSQVQHIHLIAKLLPQIKHLHMQPWQKVIYTATGKLGGCTTIMDIEQGNG